MHSTSLCLLAALIVAITLTALPQQSPAVSAGEPRWEIAYDFGDHLQDQDTQNPNSAATAPTTIGGRSRNSIFQHPDAPEKPLVQLTYKVDLPQLNTGEKLVLRTYLGIKEGFDISKSPEFDGVAFIAELDGTEIINVKHAKQEWLLQEVDISSHAGQTVSFTFSTDPLTTSSYDWAQWGLPQVLIVGRPAKVPPIPPVSTLSLAAISKRPTQKRIFSSISDSRSVVVVAVMDANLDLAAQLRQCSTKAGKQVPFAPEMVVGEGPDPENHTLVKVLNRYGIPDVEFLAYPLNVKGGVNVEAAKSSRFGSVIVASPISSTGTHDIRIFNRWGGLIGSFAPKAIAPPYAIAAGHFLQRPDDVIAVTSRKNGSSVCLFNLDGKEIKRLKTSLSAVPVSLCRMEDGRLLIQAGQTVYALNANTGQEEDVTPSGLPDGWTVYPSAFGGALTASGPEEQLSTLLAFLPNQEPARVDAGRRENLFWVQWGKEVNGQYVQNLDLPEAKHIKASNYRHLRVDTAAQGMVTPASDRWDEKAFLAPFGEGDQFAEYNKPYPSLFEPCFSHRWFKSIFEKDWLSAKDPASGLPEYATLSRKNNPVTYGEFGNIDFYVGTYAFGLPTLEKVYTEPLRVFLQRLAVEFRRDTTKLVALEPNHEHEIAVDIDSTVGDYNTKNIEGFFDYLRNLYGSDLGAMQAKLGTNFRDYCDVPRQEDRGDWDTYDKSNPFYTDWSNYNRYVVNRRLAVSYREALLAGFPPEIIKCHQIPDLYAVGDLAAFSTVTSRITPIDYAMAAGVGFGFTRYGVWYKRPHDALDGAKSSGFDSVTMGEYQALTADKEEAYNQLNHIFENGVASASCMLWPKDFDQGFNASMDYAIKRLIENDRPRPGVTGGVGQVRAYQQGSRRFNVAVIGTGSEHNGLLKSLDSAGEWEGSVYAVPFRAHENVKQLDAKPSLKLTSKPYTLGPLKGLDSGEQIEIVFRARSRKASGNIIFDAASAIPGGKLVPLPGLNRRIAFGKDWKSCRIVLRVQLPVEDVVLQLMPSGTVELKDLAVYRETQMIAKPTRGIFTGQRHKGGITFDVLR